ncbi:UDP-N-acetylmuramate dehydrogenase [Candidatus Kaiserbacteria bacterium]|nr:UDP-N-acetylmuramate dehydrogenase [Candidatus Kaiserbacteria bacterium]
MNIQTQVSLAPYTTFGIGGNAEFFVEVRSVEELKEAVLWAKEKGISVTVLGGGSNVLVSDRGVTGLVICNKIEGITYEDEMVHVGAGVVFDDLVLETVEKGLWGLENLSAIPGTVGAAPIQNIGAYGVEVSSVIESVHTSHLTDGSERVFSNKACAFGYRDSFFKTEEGRNYIVTGVTFHLKKEGDPHIEYKDLQNYFIDTPTQRQVRDAVIEIRSKKFPDWHKKGTGGSFFKNPIISKEQYEVLEKKYPELPGFPVGDRVKVPLGWILDKVLHIKGVTNERGTVGTYEGQALVIVNHGGATAEEVDAFAQKIAEDVFGITDIRIEREVRSI